MTIVPVDFVDEMRRYLGYSGVIVRHQRLMLSTVFWP